MSPASPSRPRRHAPAAWFALLATAGLLWLCFNDAVMGMMVSDRGLIIVAAIGYPVTMFMLHRLWVDTVPTWWLTLLASALLWLLVFYALGRLIWRRPPRAPGG